MIAGLIFAISIMTLLQFFVSYTRSLIAQSQGHELSEQAREICGLTGEPVTVDQFRRLEQLIALCPGWRGAHLVELGDSFRCAMDRGGTWRLRPRRRRGFGPPDRLQPNDHDATIEPLDLV
jgi:hypothetical protein